MMTPEEEQYHKSCNKIIGVESSKMFGSPCYKIHKKAFCCFYGNQMVFKLTGEAHSEALSLDGAERFDPSKKGRPMKEWVQLPYDYHELWPAFAKAAAKYVGEMYG